MSHSTLCAGGVYTDLAELINMRHRVREIQLFSSPSHRSPLIGLHHSKLRGRGVDFDQVRIYQPGDDIRTIDWRVTARTQEPHTKLFHEERERPIFLLVEQSRRLFLGSALCFKSVLAAHAAALLGWSALAHNDRVGGLIFSDTQHFEIRPRRHKQALLQLLNRLSLANQALNTSAHVSVDNLAPALRRAREVLRPGSLVMLICDERALTDNAIAQLSLLARHTDVLLLPVSDPLDHQLPDAGVLRFAQDRAVLNIDTHASLRQAYADLAKTRALKWQQLAKKLRIPLLPLSTGRDVLEQFKELLSQHSGAVNEPR